MNAKLILTILILFLFMVPALIGMSISDLAVPPPNWLEACQWIKDNTPGDALIITWWDYGYWIEYIAEREAYLTPAQNPERTSRIARNFISTEDAEWPGDNTYILISYNVAYNFKYPVATWAEVDQLAVDWHRTLVVRLYEGRITESYDLIYDNGDIKIWRVRE